MHDQDLVELVNDVKALREEVRAMQDERSIAGLILGYGPRVDAAADDERAAALANMWIEDGEYDVGGVGVRHGRQEIAETYRARHHANVRQGIAHVMGAPSIDIRGDKAVAFNYSCVFRSQGETFFPWRVSVNEWHLTRNGDGWKVARRVNRMVDGGEAARAIVDAAALRHEVSE